MTRIDGAPDDTSVTDILAAAPGIAAVLQAECASFLREMGWKPLPFH